MIDVAHAEQSGTRLVDIGDNATACAAAETPSAHSRDPAHRGRRRSALTTRDATSAVGLESQLLGARVHPQRALAPAIRQVGDYPGLRSVYEIDRSGSRT